MVSSPNYERLKVFMEAARANQGLDAWDADHEKTMQGFEQAIDRLKAYRDGHGFSGKTGDAMNRWVDRSIKRIEGYRAKYQRGYNGYSAGRQSMASALKEAEALSPDLLDSATSAMRYLPVVALPSSAPGGGVEVGPVRFTTGAAYVDGVEAQANAQREGSAQRILDMVNGKTKLFSTIVKSPGSTEGVDGDPTKQSGQESDGAGSTPPHDPWDYSPGDGYGRAKGRDPRSGAYPGGFDQPWLSEADAAAARNRTIASGALETREPAYGEVGSRTNPITDPQDLMNTDLLHTRVNGTAYRNGVVGGHTPAPPADVDHPLWRLNGGGASSDSSVAGRLGGAGVLGAGGLGLRGAARMGSGSLGSAGGAGAAGLRGLGGAGAAGLRGISGSTGGAGGAGAAGLKVGSYSGPGFGSYKPPAGVAGANGVAGSGAAGSSGVTGTTGAGGAGGAAGAAGRGGAGAGGFMGGGAGAGAGAGKEDKKSRRRKYVAFRFEDEDEDGLPAGYVNPMSQTYGSDKDIAPAKRADDGWDPRQW